MSTTYRTLARSVQIDNGVDSPFEVASTLISGEVSLGVEQDNASCTVTLSVYPDDVDLRYRLYVYGRTDGGALGSAILFNGEIVGIRQNSDTTVTLTATDYLARLNYAWSDTPRTYTSQDSSAVVQNLVEASGIDVSLTDIQAPSGWTIGVGADVVLETGDTPRDLIRRIDESEPFWKTWTRPNGAIRRRPMPNVNTASSVATITYGSQIISEDWEYTLDGMYNAAQVTGAVYNDVPIDETYQAGTGGYIPDPPRYFTTRLDSYLIEDPTRALAVATDLATNLNNTKRQGSITVALRHDIEPGDVITVSGGAVDGRAYVVSVRHDLAAATTTYGLRRPSWRR